MSQTYFPVTMSSCIHIVIFIILICKEECGAQVHVVYKSVGEKAHLTLKKDWNITSVKWRKDNKLFATVENQKPLLKIPQKFHIHISDKSLFIHNLTVNDSGFYKAQTGQWEEEIIQYNLIVQEPVSEPVINASLSSQSNSSSVCHMLVKCSVDGDSVTYDCDSQHCIQTNATITRVNISINYTDNGILECSASNRVSTKRTSVHINNKCSEKPPVTQEKINYTVVLIITIICTLSFGVMMITIIVHGTRKEKQIERTFHEDKSVNTVYSVVRKQPRPEIPADSSSAQNAATTVYDVPSKCARAASSESHDFAKKEDTETIYWKLGQTQGP